MLFFTFSCQISFLWLASLPLIFLSRFHSSFRHLFCFFPLPCRSKNMNLSVENYLLSSTLCPYGCTTKRSSTATWPLCLDICSWVTYFLLFTTTWSVFVCPANQRLKSTIKKKEPTNLCAPREFLNKCICHVWYSYHLVILTITFRMFSLRDLCSVLCSRSTTRAKDCRLFLNLNYPQIKEIGNSDHIAGPRPWKLTTTTTTTNPIDKDWQENYCIWYSVMYSEHTLTNDYVL